MDSIYGNHRPVMEAEMQRLLEDVERIRQKLTEKNGMDPVEHVLSRIKSEESMREKCRRKQLSETTESALFRIHDGIGIRIVCSFVSDVYSFCEEIRKLDHLTVMEEKDYIRHAKPNGYRSFHMIVKLSCGYFAEIQVRTISMDTWAALEHHMKYKKQIGGNHSLIAEELKRCADELASTDISMQTLRDMIVSGVNENEDSAC